MNVLIILLDLFLLAYVVFALFNYMRAFVKRLLFMAKLKKMARGKHWTVRFTRSPFASFFRYSKKPDIVLLTDDTEFVIRYVTAISRKRQYHFASEEHLVTYAQTAYALPMAVKTSEMNGNLKYFHLPELTPLPDPTAGRRRVHVLLFNPAPVNITYINEGGRQEIAGDTSRIGGWTTCGASGFFRFIVPESND